MGVNEKGRKENNKKRGGKGKGTIGSRQREETEGKATKGKRKSTGRIREKTLHRVTPARRETANMTIFRVFELPYAHPFTDADEI